MQTSFQMKMLHNENKKDVNRKCRMCLEKQCVCFSVKKIKLHTTELRSGIEMHVCHCV